MAIGQNEARKVYTKAQSKKRIRKILAKPTMTTVKNKDQTLYKTTGFFKSDKPEYSLDKGYATKIHNKKKHGYNIMKKYIGK